MNIVRTLIEGLKLFALFGAVALVVWGMPDREPQQLAADAGRIAILDH